jgi:methyl-accepting chemotaxis protein
MSHRIEKIVDAIASLSTQTNMLAVNGSIEAARTEEFGKGFGVVAADIRTLAHDSADNAERIKDLVKAVQDQIGEVGHDLADIMSSATRETEKARSVTLSLTSMQLDAGLIDTGAREILASANEIALALSEVKTGINQIATASQLSERACDEASSAARQQAEGADELSAAIESIAAVADELQNG